MDAPRFVLFGVLAAVVLAWSAVPAQARSAPPFFVTDIDGTVWSSSGLMGRPYLLDFSAVWCVPCHAVNGGLAELFPTYGARVQFLSVYLPPQNDQATLVAHRQNEGISWPIATETDNVSASYGVFSIPRAFFIDATGTIRGDWSPTTEPTPEGVRQAFSQKMDALLDAGTPTSSAPPALWFLPAVGSSVAGLLMAVVLRPRKPRDA